MRECLRIRVNVQVLTHIQATQIDVFHRSKGPALAAAIATRYV